MTEKPCPFCNLDPEQNRIMMECERYFVMLSNPRLMEGHLLVIPKTHVGAIFHLDGATRTAMFEMALRLQEQLIDVFSRHWNTPAGCDVWCDMSWHTRPFMPQTNVSIPGHAHIHLRPRHYKDQYYQMIQCFETDFFLVLPPDEIARETEKFKVLLFG